MWNRQIFIVILLVGLILAKTLPKKKKFRKLVNKGKLEKGKERKLLKKIFKGNNPNNENAANKKAGRYMGDMRFADEGHEKRAATMTNNWLISNMVNGALTIPYKMENSLSDSDKTTITSALATMNSLLKCHSPFVPYDAAKHSNVHYLSYFKGSGCWSFVGRVNNLEDYTGYQPISIGNGCAYPGTVMHETLHAMGFYHEQSRPDRDSYVTIHYENIRNGTEGNFKKVSTVHDVSNKSPYDYQSVMHYGENYFSKNGQPTITVKDSTAEIGQRTDLSPIDVAEWNNYFNCDGGNYVTTTTTTTTQAPYTGSAELLRGTAFTKKYQDNNVHYSSWPITGCFNKYSNCDDFKPYCSSTDWVKQDCALTCDCPAGDESYISLPASTDTSSTATIKGKYFWTSLNADNELIDKKICPSCTSKPCPTYEFCVKLKYQRTATSGDKSRLSITAFNYDNNNYFTDVFVSYPVGNRAEDPAYRYTLSQNMRLECNNLDMYVNGTKATDELRVHDFKLYRGPCSSV